MARRTSPVEPDAEDGEGRCWHCLSLLPWPALTSVLLLIPGVIVWAVFANKCTNSTFAFFNVVTPVAPDTLAVASNAVYTTLVTLLVASTGIVTIALVMAILRGVQERSTHPDSACPCVRTDAAAIYVYTAFNLGFNIILWLVQLAIVLLLMGALTWLVVVLAASLTIQNSVSDSAAIGTSPLAGLQNATRNYTNAVAVYEGRMRSPPTCIRNSTWLRGLNSSLNVLLLDPLDPSTSSTVLCPYNCLNLGSFATLFKLPQNCVCDPARLTQLQQQSSRAATEAGIALGGLVLVYIACGILHASLTAAYVSAKRDYAAAIDAEEKSLLRSSHKGSKGSSRGGGDDGDGDDALGDVEQGKGGGNDQGPGDSSARVLASRAVPRPSSARSNKGLATVSSPLAAPKQQRMQGAGSNQDMRSGHSAPAVPPSAGRTVTLTGAVSMDDELSEIELAAAAGVFAASRALTHAGSAREHAGHTSGPMPPASGLAELVMLGAAGSSGAGHRRNGSTVSSVATPRHHNGSSGGSAHEVAPELSAFQAAAASGSFHRRSTSCASSGTDGAEHGVGSRPHSHLSAGDHGAVGAPDAERMQANASSEFISGWRTIRGLEEAGFASMRRSVPKRPALDIPSAFPASAAQFEDDTLPTSVSAPAPGKGAIALASAAAAAAEQHGAAGALNGKAGSNSRRSSAGSSPWRSTSVDRRSQLRILVDDSPLAPPIITPTHNQPSASSAALEWADMASEPLPSSGRASSSPASAYYGSSSSHSLQQQQQHMYMDGSALGSPALPAPGVAISPISEGPEGPVSSGYSSDSGLSSTRDVSSPYPKQAWRASVRKSMLAYDQYKKPRRSAADAGQTPPAAPPATQQGQAPSDPRRDLSRRYRNRVPAI